MNTSKITVSVDKGAANTIRVGVQDKNTGADLRTEDIEAGKDAVFEIGEDQQIAITRGAATPEPEETSTKGKK